MHEITPQARQPIPNKSRGKRYARLATLVLCALGFSAIPLGSFAADRQAAAVNLSNFAESDSILMLRQGRHKFYAIDQANGAITRQFNLDVTTPVIYRAAGDPVEFNGRSFVGVQSGPLEGWWVATDEAGPSTSQSSAVSFQARLTAGTYAGIRFFPDRRLSLRQRVTLTADETFTAGAQWTTDGRTFVYVTSGPLADRWVNARRLTIVGSAQTSTSSDSAASPVPIATAISTGTAPSPSPVAVRPPATWKGLLLLYRETDVTFTRSDGTNYRLTARMSDSMYELSRDVFARFVRSVSSWSDGYAEMDLTIVEVDHPVTQLESMSGGRYWLAPRSIRADLDRYAPAGTYDSIFALWQAKDSNGVQIPVGGWGLSLPPGSWSNGAGYSSIITPSHEWWWRNDDNPEEVVVHEWLHQVVFFHEHAGRIDLDLHATTEFGYQEIDGSWKRWYSDVMRGTVRDGDGFTGITYDMWRSGTPTRPNAQ